MAGTGSGPGVGDIFNIFVCLSVFGVFTSECRGASTGRNISDSSTLFPCLTGCITSREVPSLELNVPERNIQATLNENNCPRGLFVPQTDVCGFTMIETS